MRYLPLSSHDRAAMLQTIGVNTVDDLFAGVPARVLNRCAPDLPNHQGEQAVETIIARYAAQNRSADQGPFFLGAGCYNHFIPATVDYIIQRSEFLTSYTPYQPEIAQGTLQVIFEFQTMIALITGQDVANASMYDGATSLAEAVLMALRVTGRRNVSVAGALHPHYREVLETYLRNLDGTSLTDHDPDQDTAALIVQYPDFEGGIADLMALRARCDSSGAMLIVVINEILALGLLPPPTHADIVCGEAQSIGLPMSFGGPHLGFFACRDTYLRQMPGRLCGETVDVSGKRGFVLTLNTREQHIRREKATSNICTNQGLCALAFTVHMALLGDDGFRHLARLNHERACALADMLDKIPGYRVLTSRFFNEFTIQTPVDSFQLRNDLLTRGIIAGYPLPDQRLIIAVTEKTTEGDIALLREALGSVY